MQFRKFEANDMRAALAQVKAALGADAVIVATREIRGNRFFGRRLEVTAALDDPPPTSLPRGHGGINSEALEEKLTPLRRELRALRGALHRTDPETDVVRQELAQLRAMLTTLTQQSLAQPETAVTASSQRLMAQLLLRADVETEVAHRLANDGVKNLDANTEATVAAQLAGLKLAVARMLRCDPSFFQAPRRVALVGPTGVGKTTSIAKIAAHGALIHRRRVALISLDTYRVAAFEQLKQYASLMEVPLHLARDADSFAAALDACGDADLVLVDTAGRSPNHDAGHRAQLAEMFVQHRVAPYLTIAATTRCSEVHGILRAYAPLDPQAFVCTKLDEAAVLGALCNVAARCPIPLAFVCNGQRVPEDLHSANADALAAQLVDRVFETHRVVWQRGAQKAEDHVL